MAEQVNPDYTAWNDALAARYFNLEKSGQPVCLYVNEDVINEVGRGLGSDFDGFKDALRAGPAGTTHRAGHCQRALQVASRWRERLFLYPPYLAYLILFVLAGGREGDYGPRSYYPRLWDLLGQHETGTPPSFDRMLELWDDLEQWSTRDRDGELGLFEARIVGGKIHIGLPLAQTVLTDAERLALPRIFSRARFEPGSLPSDRELKRAMTVQGRQWLRRQTVSALEKGDDGYSSALLEIISDEFLTWDGALAVGDSRDRGVGSVQAGLRICLSIDRTARSASSALRCRSKRELPTDELLLTSSRGLGPVSCTSFLPEWSQPLRVGSESAVFAPSVSEWRLGLELGDAESGWSLRLRPAEVRAFVHGAGEQLPGLVEEHVIPQDAPFYLAYHDDSRDVIEHWIEQDCDGWQPIELNSGIPHDWSFGALARARSDRGPRSLAGGLAFPDRCILRFAGGIRAGAGNTFFSFAPPNIALSGAAPGDVVLCDGKTLEENPDAPGVYELPHNLPADSRVVIELSRGDEILKRRSVFLVAGSSWRVDEPLFVVDEFGGESRSGTGVAGAMVPFSSGGAFRFDPLRTPGLHKGEQRAYFIGRSPGQVVDWPREALPAWEPVWAVPFGRRGRALYCGGSLDGAWPVRVAEGTESQRELWRNILWKRRGRISPPKERTLLSLWARYQAAARG